MADEVAARAAADADTIATRTRTKLSLVDVPIDALEASLPATAADYAALESEDDREYQRFLASLLPNEQEDLAFLDEEDEEYHPDDEDDEEDDERDDDDAQERRRMMRGISKKELTDLLLDSTTLPFPVATLPVSNVAVATTEEILGDEARPRLGGGSMAAGPNHASVQTPLAASFPSIAAGDKNDVISEVRSGSVPIKRASAVQNLGSAAAPAFRQRSSRGLHGTATQEQCIQLASQMHKHLQLLLQSYHLFAADSPTPALAECRAMIEELQLRGEKALRYKNALLSKLNPGTTSSFSNGGDISKNASALDEDTTASKGQTASSTDVISAGDSGGIIDNTTEDFLALRRVTRSLTAAHAAVANPSMFELVGSQTVDELSAVFARGCSLEERDRSMQEQMLQLDTHLLRVKKRKNRKKAFTPSEDNLLAHGAKRFGVQSDSWDQIQRHFLPRKSSQLLRHRYRYLASSKTGMSAVKALHHQVPHRRDAGWLLEEDLRVARGLMELHGGKNLFARLAKTYLPHRSRIEIRKRWGRLAAKFRAELAGVGLTAPDDDALDFAVAMKANLEAKLRDRVLRQKGTPEIEKLDAALQLQQLGLGVRKTHVKRRRKDSVAADGDGAKAAEAILCKTKNLHPALFFTSWSFISPATLLGSTCTHNWPSFIDEGKETTLENRQTDTATVETRDLAVATSVPQVSVDGTHPERESPQLADGGVQPQTLEGDQGEGIVSIAMAQRTSDVQATHVQSITTPDVVMEPNQSGPAQPLRDGTTFALEEGLKEGEDDEDDDSDYEHDELLSSENEDSDSEFEQMELSDDDDDDDDEDEEDDAGSVDVVDRDAWLSDSDELSVHSVESPWMSSQVTHTSPSLPPLPPRSPISYAALSSLDDSTPCSPVRHPLRLQNLAQPGNSRMKRALNALERRIVGKRVEGDAPSSSHPRAQSTGTSSSKRIPRKVALTFVAPLRGTHSNKRSLRQASQGVEEAPHATGQYPKEHSSDAGSVDAIVTRDDDDDNDWEDGSGDEGFEVEELPSSSDELSSASADEEDQSPRRNAPAINRLPNKKPKLQRCSTCGNFTCTCSSSVRMQQLLRRMKEKRSSSALQ
ncbi:hypothetical protein BBJ28_00012613 [Nothophytophthora sp. Chile5]|nr:hypothetical protein BBJ28_00012613 [Nothophytophthora sp. Chile5]